MTTGAPTPAAEAVAELYLADHIRAPTGPSAPRAPATQKPPSPTLSAAQLAAYAGVYSSDEAEASFTIAVNGDALVLKRRPDTTMRLAATGTDSFDAPVGGLRFIRDAAGKITELSVAPGRVFDMRFKRQ